MWAAAQMKGAEFLLEICYEELFADFKKARYSTVISKEEEGGHLSTAFPKTHLVLLAECLKHGSYPIVDTAIL